MPSPKGRFIPLHEGGPAENMSIDQALLESVDASGEPVLRLYTWSVPTLSLGYFQKLGERNDHIESAGLACVRRVTGGGAIVHHRELTYSIAVPLRGFTAAPRMDLYRQTHLAVIRGLTAFGVHVHPFQTTRDQAYKDELSKDSFLCFQRRTDEDLVLSGYKVLGSHQRKTRNAVLQHGSLLMRASEWAPQLPGVCDLTSKAIPIQPFTERFAAALGDLFSISWMVGKISREESLRASAIAAQKFASDTWLSRR